MPALDVACYFHSRDLAPLLAVTLSAAHAAQALGVHAYVERHWLHGPHLRVRLGVDGADDAGRLLETVADDVRAALVAHLAAHPCPPDADPAELLASSVIAGRAELVPGPYEPIHPHGTVRIEAVDDSALVALLGGREAIRVRAALLAAGTRPLTVAANHLLDGVAARDETAATNARVRIALAAFTAHAARYPTGIADGHHTLLSHVEDFLHDHDPNGRVRARLAAQWSRHGDRVTAGVRRVLDGPQGLLDATWAAWADLAWRTCLPAYASGHLPLEQGPEYQRRAAGLGSEAAARWNPSGRPLSEYHQRLRLVDYITGNEAHIAAYRFATNMLYRLLLACGVSPLERLLAAHLVAEAAQRITGRRWRTHLPPLLS